MAGGVALKNLLRHTGILDSRRRKWEALNIAKEIIDYIDLVLRGAALCGRWSWDGAGIVTGGEDGAVKIWSRLVFILISPQNVFANRQCPMLIFFIMNSQLGGANQNFAQERNASFHACHKLKSCLCSCLGS